MSVLSNVTLLNYLLEGRIKIDPLPRFESDYSFDPCSVQLHMDDIVQEPKEDLKLAFDLSQIGQLSKTIDLIFEEIKIRDSGYVLEPGKLILANTKETICFPPPSKNGDRILAGRIEGRSSFARTGLLVHFTAPTIHSGFKGKITLELLNHGPMPLLLKPGLSICQLIVETVRGVPLLGNPSQFQNQNTPSGTNNIDNN